MHTSQCVDLNFLWIPLCQFVQYLTNITELAVSMKRLPQDVVLPFFKRLQDAPQRAGFDTVGAAVMIS